MGLTNPHSPPPTLQWACSFYEGAFQFSYKFHFMRYFYWKWLVLISCKVFRSRCQMRLQKYFDPILLEILGNMP